MSSQLRAGSAVGDITPKDSVFLSGYPHVERYSTGVHDPLLSSALYISDGRSEAMFIAHDILYIPKDLASRARARIEDACGIPVGNIMVTATHTHSGPRTMDFVGSSGDSVVPAVVPAHLDAIEEVIVATGVKAVQSAEPAQVGLAVADATGIGTNRRDPAGPADLEVPVLMVRSADGQKNIAAMLVCCMHPTVLHEDSKLISGDFPAMARQYLQVNVLGDDCPVLHHIGPAGNQSPRHVTKANTFEEAIRLGTILGQAAEKAVSQIEYTDDVQIAAVQSFVELVPKEFPNKQQAGELLDTAVKKLEDLRSQNAPHVDVRTAECDWFGAERTLTFAEAVADGRVDKARRAVMPAEIQVLAIGPWAFVGWHGELFVEYDLAVKKAFKNTYVIALANGELQGYIVTPEAVAEGGYEAATALFAPESGKILVDSTLELLRQLNK